MKIQKEEDIESLEELEEKVKSIKEDFSESLSSLLFRGQANQDWKLDTTLDRVHAVQRKYTLDYHHRMLMRIHGGVSAVYDRTWNLMSTTEYDSYLSGFFRDCLLGATPFEGYDFMAFLRHHGFPSPLLDWTTALHVAVYFAFREYLNEVERVSVYVFLECPINQKGLSSNSPMIFQIPRSHGNHHKRHYLQECRHTVCVKYLAEGISYIPHEEYYTDQTAHWNERQDYMWKFNLPSSIRSEVLKNFDSHRLNDYTLFNSLESWLFYQNIKEYVQNA